MKKYQIAQINIAKAVADMDSEMMSGFVSRLDEINALADSADGFVWRLQTEDGDSTAIRVFDDPLLIINITVWDSIEALKSFVYRTAHVELIQHREAWFSKISSMHQTLWWIPEGHIPSIEESKGRLDYLNKHGPSSKAFNFGKPFPQPE